MEKWTLILVAALIVVTISTVAIVNDLSKGQGNRTIKASGTIMSPYRPYYYLPPYLPYWNNSYPLYLP